MEYLYIARITAYASPLWQAIILAWRFPDVESRTSWSGLTNFLTSSFLLPNPNRFLIVSILRTKWVMLTIILDDISLHILYEPARKTDFVMRPATILTPHQSSPDGCNVRLEGPASVLARLEMTTSWPASQCRCYGSLAGKCSLPWVVLAFHSVHR